MLYRIMLWRTINLNTGNTTLVYLTKDENEYIAHLDSLITIFRDNGSFIKVSMYENNGIRTAYIEYDMRRVKVQYE